MRKAALIGLAIAAAAVGVASSTGGGSGRSEPTARPGGTSAAASATTAVDVGFNYLARQTSNQCGLEAAGIMRMPDTQRLQGSCCSPMRRAAYRRQAHYLSRYRDVSLIPKDPYDISAAVAKRLLRDRDIKLSRSQRATYRRAMGLTRERGPCCCRCWRRQAFRGLSYRLIAREHWPAPRLAKLIQALDGCGGPWSGPQLDRPA